MVKLRGPMLSAEASGTLGNAAILSSWKGRAYAKAYAIPSNPRTAMQTANRAVMRFLAQVWNDVPAPEKAMWVALAQEMGIPSYNAFIRTNLERWAMFKAPSMYYPVTNGGALPTATLETATGHAGYADVVLNIRNDRDTFCVMLFRDQVTPVVPAKHNLIAMLPNWIEDDFTYKDEALPAGTYYYQARFCTNRGGMGPNETQRTAVVT